METVDLKPGDIDTGSGADMVVTSLMLTDRIEPTYNLTVADWHTFMVGEDGAVVHNIDCNKVRGGFEKQLQRDGRRSLEKSLASTTQNLAEHQADLARYRQQGGYTSSVEREIRTFQTQIDILEDMLGIR